MTKLLVALGLAFLLAGPAFADAPERSDNKGQRDTPSAFRVGKVFGEYVGLSQTDDATFSAVDFGFEADYVELCMEDDSNRAYMRFGTALPAAASSSSNFIDGVSGLGGLPGQAVPIFQSGDGTDVLCVSGPWATNGVVLHTTGDASVDVRAYAE